MRTIKKPQTEVKTVYHNDRTMSIPFWGFFWIFSKINSARVAQRVHSVTYARLRTRSRARGDFAEYDSAVFNCGRLHAPGGDIPIDDSEREGILKKMKDGAAYGAGTVFL